MWSGWSSINDKEKSKTYTTLVEHSKDIIPHMPWEPALHKEKMLHPDFSSLDIISFAGDRLPSGINIPNYYDIRENDGFKNVVFQNKEVTLKNTKAMGMPPKK
jgi:dipeptidyl-peptidase-3